MVLWNWPNEVIIINKFSHIISPPIILRRSILLIFSFSLFFQSSSYAFNILIDPGHGGSEYGAHSKIRIGKKVKKVYEKDLTLMLAKKLKKLLDKKYNVYLTRSYDKNLSLLERAKMADLIKADLFISIHFNSTKSPQARGIETYYLDNHKNKAIKKVEEVENASLNKEDKKVVNKILIDLAISLTSKKSKELAEVVHKSIIGKMKNKFSIRNRSFKPGMFFVLALSKRPGILIEAGFISNKKELRKIIHTQYMDQFALALSKGVEKYVGKNKKESMEVLSMDSRREREEH